MLQNRPYAIYYHARGAGLRIGPHVYMVGLSSGPSLGRRGHRAALASWP